MIKIVDKHECCGCGACEQICPSKCIRLKTDREGFLYPEVDQKACVSCNLCEKVCPVKIDKNSAGDRKPLAYAGWHKNDEVRADSSSGGAFTAVAEYIIKEGGIVYGCTLNENMDAIHVGVETIEDLVKLRGSKYVQSRIEHVYLEIKAHLQSGRKVLFVGAPCQAAGLCRFLGKKYEDLYTIDFICHGVPSPGLFHRYIAELEQKHNKKVAAYKFRNKDHGWNSSGMQLGTKIGFPDGTYIRKYPAFMDHYMNAFLDDVCLRPSCYECMFKDAVKDYSDFTIADFWGVNNISKDLNDGKGTSLLLVHNAHASELLEKIKDQFYYKQVDFEQAIRRNRSLTRSAKLNPNRKRFYEELEAKGYQYVERKYMLAFTWAAHKVFNMVSNKFGQFIKFAIVGCSNTIISLAVYYLCIFLGVNYLLAYTLGFLISVCNAFFWNNKYVFVNKQETSISKAFVKVFASYGFSFLLSIVLMSLLVEVCSVSSLIAPILKMAIVIPLNFVLNKIWAFKDRKDKGAEEVN